MMAALALAQAPSCALLTRLVLLVLLASSAVALGHRGREARADAEFPRRFAATPLVVRVSDGARFVQVPWQSEENSAQDMSSSSSSSGAAASASASVQREESSAASSTESWRATNSASASASSASAESSSPSQSLSSSTESSSASVSSEGSSMQAFQASSAQSQTSSSSASSVSSQSSSSAQSAFVLPKGGTLIKARGVYSISATRVVRNGKADTKDPATSADASARAAAIITAEAIAHVHRECPRIPCKGHQLAPNVTCPLPNGICCARGGVCCPADATCLNTDPPTCVHDEENEENQCAEAECKANHHCPHEGVLTCCLGGLVCCPHGFKCRATNPPSCERMVDALDIARHEREEVEYAKRKREELQNAIRERNAKHSGAVEEQARKSQAAHDKAAAQHAAAAESENKQHAKDVEEAKKRAEKELQARVVEAETKDAEARTEAEKRRADEEALKARKALEQNEKAEGVTREEQAKTTARLREQGEKEAEARAKREAEEVQKRAEQEAKRREQEDKHQAQRREQEDKQRRAEEQRAKGPSLQDLCVLAPYCAGNWEFRGVVGVILHHGEYHLNPFGGGGDYGWGWRWTHPQLCCATREHPGYYQDMFSVGLTCIRERRGTMGMIVDNHHWHHMPTNVLSRGGNYNGSWRWVHAQLCRINDVSVMQRVQTHHHPTCLFGRHRCPSGWRDYGYAGIIMANGHYHLNPFARGGGFNGGWTWTHPRVCCLQ